MFLFNAKQCEVGPIPGSLAPNPNVGINLSVSYSSKILPIAVIAYMY